MDDPPRLPDPKLVHNLYRRGLKPQVLRIALLLDVFSTMKDGPLDAQGVAKVCGCDATGMGLLLDCLSGFGLLEKQDNSYYLTPTSSTFFVRTQHSYVGNWVLEQTDPNIFQQMLQSLRDGVPFRRSMPWEESAWLESYDVVRRIDSLQMWQTAGIDPKQYSQLRVLDLACGCSVMSLALAKSNPCVQVTCVDDPKVLEVARDLAKRQNLMTQITCLPGDLHLLELGENQFDVVLLGNATNFFTPQQNIALFQRIYKALSDNGLAVINVTMMSQKTNEQVGLYSLILWTFSGTAFFSFSDYQDWLTEAGFKHIEKLSDLWLSARK